MLVRRLFPFNQKGFMKKKYYLISHNLQAKFYTKINHLVVNFKSTENPKNKLHSHLLTSPQAPQNL